MSEFTATARATITFDEQVYEMPPAAEPHPAQVTILKEPGAPTGTGTLYVRGFRVGRAVATRTRGEWVHGVHGVGDPEYLVTETEIDAILEWRHEDPVPGVPFGA